MTIRLPGLTSRWTTPWACALARPSATSRAISSGLGDRQRAAFELLLQRLAFVVGHDDEQPPIVGVLDVVDDADVAVVGRGRGLRLAHEALLCAPSSWLHCGGRNFSATVATELGVARLVDDAHPAAAQLGDDVVVRDRAANQRIGRSVGQTAEPGPLYHSTLRYFGGQHFRVIWRSSVSCRRAFGLPLGSPSVPIVLRDWDRSPPWTRSRTPWSDVPWH